MSAGGGGGTGPPAGGPPGKSMWDERYGDENEFAYGTKPNDFLVQVLPTLSFGGSTETDKGTEEEKLSCLLLADGEGRNGVYMAEQEKFGHIVSVDYSEVGMKKASQLATSRGVGDKVKTVVADLADYNFFADIPSKDGDGTTTGYDCIVGIFCHFPPPIRTRVLNEIPKVLKPGGYFILECYTPDQIPYKTGGPPVPALMYSKEILSKAYDADDGTSSNTLIIKRNEELVREVIEGQYHTGKAAVVQFIGQKPPNP